MVSLTSQTLHPLGEKVPLHADWTPQPVWKLLTLPEIKQRILSCSRYGIDKYVSARREIIVTVHNLGISFRLLVTLSVNGSHCACDIQSIHKIMVRC
jgi:hypothetical protein